MYSKVSLYKENANKEKFVVVYYRHDGNALRRRTGITVQVKNWDKKTSNVKQADENYKKKNNTISDSLELIEQIITEYLEEYGIKPTSEYVKNELKLGRKLKKEKAEAAVIDCYADFLNYKRLEFSTPERSITSLKDYVSTQNALIDYTQLVGTINPINLNNRTWLNQFNSFLAAIRKDIPNYKFITSAQGEKTRAKRFSVLKEFGKWLVENKYLNSYEVLREYKIKVKKSKYYALSLEEIKEIQDFIFEKKTHQNAIDMFIVACHTGVRISDVGLIGKSKITQFGSTKMLRMDAFKTKERFEVPLTEKVIEILEKHNYKLSLMADAKVNHYIHEALEKIETFKKEYEYGANADAKPLFKLITFHTGRRTFITNLVNSNISINAIMKMTGHKKISTLQEYINPDYPLLIENVKIFNDL